jgi:hypothetical protein
LKQIEGDHKTITSENRILKSQKEKNEATQRQLEKEFEQVQRQERSQRDEWSRKLNDLESSIQDRKQLITEVLDGLSIVNQEIASLKVQTKTAQYKVQY